MGPPWFLLPYSLFLPNMNETCPHPSKEGRGVVRCNGPHPSGEGRAGGWDVWYQPTSLRRGEGEKEAGRALAS